MDIEGFVRARIDDYSYDDLADILAVRIREYKNIYPIIEFLQVIILNHVFDKKIDDCRLNLQY